MNIGAVSFLEFDFETRTARLGSGSGTEVIARERAPPYFRTLVSEPPEGGSTVRVRLGSATATDAGSLYDEQPDPMLLRGAWAGLIRFCGEAALVLEGDAPSLLAQLQDSPQRLFLYYACEQAAVSFKRIDEALARKVLDQIQGPGELILEFSGSKEQVASMVSQLCRFGRAAREASSRPME